MAWGRHHIQLVCLENRELLDHALKLGEVITSRLDQDRSALKEVAGMTSDVYEEAAKLQAEINEQAALLVLAQARVGAILMSERTTQQ